MQPANPIIHTTASDPTDQQAPGRTPLQLDLAVITSITRDGHTKAVRHVTGPHAITGKPVPIGRIRAHAILTVPAAQLRVTEALAAIQALRADTDTGVPAYTSPVDLLHDLHPWIIGRADCLATLRSAACVEIRDSRDQRCGTCGVTTYGAGRIVIGKDGCPAAHCEPKCPVGVNFTTDYPIGLSVMITAGFAAGATGAIERVSDAYPGDLDGTTHYAGRSYVLTLPHWGRRAFGEDIVQPCDPALADRYLVERKQSTK